MDQSKGPTTIDDRGAAAAALDAAITGLRTLGTSERLLALYELGLEGCAQSNADQVNAVLEELIGTLDFEYADIAEGFQRVYEYCLKQCQTSGFDRVSFVLQDLRDTLLRASQDAQAGPATAAS